jgi:hypothetical protein
LSLVISLDLVGSLNTTARAMTHSQQLAFLRAEIRRQLSAKRDISDPSQVSEWRESFLVKQGIYCGHRFRSPRWLVDWRFDQQTVLVRNHAGAINRALSQRLSTISQPHRRAA